MAYFSGLIRRLRSRFRPHLRGSRHVFRLAEGRRVRFHCPDYVSPRRDAQEIELVGRIFRSFKKMKEDQRMAGEAFSPSSEWENILRLAYAPLRQGAESGNMEGFHFFLANFGAWREHQGVAPAPFILQNMQSPLRRLHLKHDVFLGQLETWKWFHGGTRPLSCLSYPTHGNQAGGFIDGVFVGPGSFFSEIYGTLLREGVLTGPRRPVVAELGAGHGKLAYFALRDLPSFSYIDFDLPETTCLAAYYLMKVWPEKRALLYGETEFHGDSLEAFDLIFMPSFEMGKLPDSSVELFINKNSLGEMTQASVHAYTKHICRSTRFFFHMNHDIRPDIYADGTRGLLARDYPVPPEAFQLLVRYPDLGHLLWQGGWNREMDIFFYLYGRR